MNTGKLGLSLSQTGANSQALKKRTFSQELKTKGQTEETNGYPYTTPFSDNNQQKILPKRYTEEELSDLKAGTAATGSVGVLKSLIQPGTLPWNSLV